MKHSKILRPAVPALFLLVALSAGAQQAAAPQVPQPKIYALSPAGAKAGTTADVKITAGTDLDGIDRLIFSHPGIVGKVVTEEPSRLYPQGRSLEGKFKVTVAADVPPGVYEVRAAGYFGVTNARRFAVGDRDEFMEKKPNTDLATAQEMGPNAVVNGTCDAANFDCYKVAAKKGQRYLAEALALRLDSRAQMVLALIDPSGREISRSVGTKSHDPLLDFTAAEDGVYVVKASDLLYRGGEEFFYRLSVGTGPWIDFVDPPVLKPNADNQITVYGRNLPGGQPADGLTIDGRPLEKLTVTIKGAAAAEPPVDTLLRPGDASADLVSWRLGNSNAVRLLLSEDPIVAEVEPNNTPDKAQAITAPVLVVGRFNPRGDRDWYVFDAKKGEKLWIEVTSQRLGLPVDPQIVLQQVEASKDLAEVDDLATPLPAMQNALEKRYRASSDDPAVLFTAPADGKYRILVRDLFGSGQGDPRLFYTLSVRPPKADFKLVAFPVETATADQKLSQVNCIVRRGGSDRLRVIAYRREGFDGVIKIEGEGLPAGLSVKTSVISAGEATTEVILKAAADAPAFAGPVKLVGKSGDLVRPMRAAEVLWNVADMQREPVVTRVTECLGVAVDEHFVAPLGLQVGADGVQRMARGGKLKIPVKLVKNADAKDLDKAQVKVVASGLPGGKNPQQKTIAMKELTLTLAKPDGDIELDITDQAPLGMVSFHVTGDVDVSYIRNPERLKKAQDEQKRIDAVAVEIVAEAKKSAEEKAKADKEAADAGSAVAKLKAAGQAEAPLKEAEDKQKLADEAKAKAVETDKKSQELAKAADAAKKEWADELKKATEAAKEKKIKVYFASLSVPLEIVASPASIKPAAESVTIKAGEKAELAVEVTREFGFADEVKLELTGAGAPVKLAAAVTVAGNQASAPVVLTTDKTAKPGTYTATLRGTLKFATKPVTVDRTFQVVIEAPPASQ